MADAPNRYDDPYYLQLASATEQKLGLPIGLLSSIVTKGEKSNADKVSDAGARTVFQITPATRRLVLDRDGIDAYLSPENAAEVAGLVAKDGVNWASTRTKDPAAIERMAAGYYHAGGDTANWGPKTNAYMARVTDGMQGAKQSALDNDFASFMASNPAVPPAGQRPQPAPAPGAQPAPATDALSQDFAGWKAAQDLKARFPNRDYNVAKIPRTPGVPGSEIVFQNDEQGRPYIDTTPIPQETLGDKIIGAGEAALSAVTGIAGYGAALNSTGATLVNAAANKLAGGPELPDTMERDSTAAGQRFTYAPRTDVGQRMAQSLGDAMQPLAGLAPAEAAALHAGAGSVVGTVRQVARGVPGGAIDAARTLGQAATDEPAVARAASEVPIQPEGAPAPGVAATPPSAPAAAVPLAAPMTAAELAQATRTAAGGGLGSDKAMHAVAGQVAPDAATVAAAKRLGVEDYLQPDHVTTNQAYRELAQAVKSIPGSEAHAAEISGLGRVAQRASALIDEVGGTRDLAELSGDVKKRLQGSADEMGGQADRLWGQLRDEVPNATKTATPATTAVLQRAVSDLGGEAEALKALPPTASKFLRPMMSGEDVTHGYLDNARKQVGQAMQKGSGPFADMEQGQLKQIYAALSQDQENVARRTSPDAYYTFQAAKYATRLQKGFEDDLSSLFGRELDRSFVGAGANSLHGAVSAASKGDASKMIKLLQSVPPEMRQNVVASGVGSIFRNAATRGEIDFGSYARWYDGLQRNRQAYGAVMSNLPLEARKQLAALHRVSAGISAATRERITTGRIQAVKDELKGPDNLISRIYDVARRSSAGLAAEAVTTPLGLPGSGLAAGIASALVKGKTDALKAADALISSQEFANATKRAIQEPAKNAVTAKALARSPAFLRFMHAISGAAPDVSGGEGWILSAIQADAGRNPAPPTDH